MARSHARIVVTVWSDQGYGSLSMRAQWFYAHLLAHPRLSLAGTIDLSERRWARLAHDATELDVVAALGELEDAGFVVIDGDTEELMVRSFTRHDLSPGRMNRNLAAGFWRTWEGILSPALRSQVAHEVPDDLWERLAEHAPPAAVETRRSPRLEPQTWSRLEPDTHMRSQPTPTPTPPPTSPADAPQTVAIDSQSDPLPAQPAEPGEQGSGTGSRRARAFAALRLMAEGELTAARNRGLEVRSDEAFVAAALTAATRRHGSKANELAHQHPEWTAEQIAAHLRAPASPADDSVSPSAIYAHADRMRALQDAESAEKGPADPNHVKSCTDAARANLAGSGEVVSGARLLKAVQ